MNWLIQKWYNKSYFCYLLTPLALFYRLAISLRRLLFKLGIKKTTKFSVPIIVVGNITVGGTGKTPLVIWLAQFLKAKGFKPGIVSRGHGGKASYYPQAVEKNSDPKIVGDEAVLIIQNTNCPMVVAPNRTLAVKKLLQDYACDIVISDDGLQHYAMARALEIAVIDGQRRFGNNFCLPAGPLREPIKRLQQVDFVVCNGSENFNEYVMQLLPRPIFNLIKPDILLTSQRANKPIHAIAAIGNPQRFFSLLRELGFIVIEHVFPDHYLFQKEDFNFGDEIIIMTEKDAVKCRSFLDQRFWCLPVVAELDQRFLETLLSKLCKMA